jgi:hypothetical protein
MSQLAKRIIIKSPLIPLFQRGNPLSPPFGKGRLGGILYNSRGLSVLFLVIAMMLMVAIGYVLSYLIPTKQKSVSLAVSSNQAFFLAQSGVEFAVRYASDNGLGSLSGPITRSLGRGSFTINYASVADRLTSIGEVPNASQRRIVVSNFTRFLGGLVLWIEPPTYTGPCWFISRTNARFYIKNIGVSNITLNSFSASWSQSTNRNLTTILMDGVTKFSGSYSSGSGVQTLATTQIITPNQVVRVNLVWNGNINPNASITISFSGGEEYIFNLGVPASSC